MTSRVTTTISKPRISATNFNHGFNGLHGFSVIEIPCRHADGPGSRAMPRYARRRRDGLPT
jgi:hypothetical protein